MNSVRRSAPPKHHPSTTKHRLERCPVLAELDALQDRTAFGNTDNRVPAGGNPDRALGLGASPPRKSKSAPLCGGSRPDRAGEVRARRRVGAVHSDAGAQGRPVRAHLRPDRPMVPATRRCSACGAVGDKLPLHLRSWTCPCGAVHDRDHNAAPDILAAGRADRSMPVEPVSDGSPVPQSAPAEA
ncbi:zinc ribbon domain-containing protein [Actinocrispum wychmicini]|uniref:zinc ribbon domain-containing protein n=1 Tax=Actinocrispum wychmicini TaxID=1213861 RepID=UPI003C7C1C00